MSPEVERHVHEAPRSMTIPLVILAVLSIVGGWVGIPAALGGGNWFEHFLEPVFAPRVTLAVAEHSHAVELLLMVLSVVVGLLGIALAYLFYVKRPEIPERLAERFRRLYRLVYNKYYVDEIYSRTFVEGPVLGKAMGEVFARFDLKVIDGIGVDGSGWFARLTSRLSIWWDTWIVDGMVNLSARIVWLLSFPTRLVQTGLVQGYALVFVLGILFLIGYYTLTLWAR